MRVFVLALDNVFDTGLATVLDAFQTANELAELSGISASRFEVSLVGVRKNVKTAQGFTVPVRPTPKRAPDCVVVPAIGFKMPEALQQALTSVEIRDAATPWQHVRLVGEDIVATEPLLPRGHTLRPYDIGALLAAG